MLTGPGSAPPLDRCAATGEREDLRWASPRSGRAVSGAAGAPWAARLPPLPGFLSGAEAPSLAAWLAAADS